MEIIKNLSPSQTDLARLNGKFWEQVITGIPTLADESEDKKFLFSFYEKFGYWYMAYSKTDR